MIDRRSCVPENAAILVKLEGDPKTYSVILPLEARLMLVQLALGLSPKGVLEIMPFDGVEFKKPEPASPVTCQKPIIYATSKRLANMFAKTKNWNPTQWEFASSLEHLKGRFGHDEQRELLILTSGMPELQVDELQEVFATGKARRFKVTEVSL